MGTVGSLSLFRKKPKDPFFVINGDLLTKVNFDRLLQFHNEQQCIATVCVSEYDFQIPYGVVEHDGHLLQKMIEKPVHSFFVNAGIYVLDPDLLMTIPKNINLDITTFIQDQINKNKDNQKVELLIGLGSSLGILTMNPEDFFKGATLPSKKNDELNIDDLIKERNLAKENKDYEEADRIRKILLKDGILLEDTAEGTIWRQK